MADFVDFLLKMTNGPYGFTIELAICEMIFILPAKTRRYAPLFVPLSVAAYFAFGFFMPFIPVRSLGAIVSSLTTFILSLLLLYLCFDMPMKRVIFNASAAYILQNITITVRQTFRVGIHWQGLGRFLYETLILVVIYTAGYFLLARRNRNKPIYMSSALVAVVSFLSVLAANVPFSLIWLGGNGDSIPVKLVCILCCVMSMLFQFSVFRGETVNNEKKIIEQLLASEQKQHKMSQANIDLINIKCHDLKKQIGLIRKGVGGDDMREMFDEVENAVMFYGDAIKTGNENLDLILTEKQLYCKKYKIRIEAIADGEALWFMSPVDVYSLFGNAVDNAIESLLQEDETKRIINIYVRLKGDIVCAKISNYCADKVLFAENLPLTTKADTASHGYGTRSMKYVAEKYNGNLVFDVENDIFSVNIILPVPKSAAESA